MIKVKIEQGNIVKQLRELIGSKETLGAVTSAVATEFTTIWYDSIDSTLSPKRASDYKHGIIRASAAVGPKAVIQLAGRYPQMIEHGNPQFDLRDALLSEKGRTHLAIPFGHDAPDASGMSGTPMGRAYSAKMGEAVGKKIGERVYAAARKLRRTNELPAGLAPKLKEGGPDEHKTDLYARMSRRPGKPYEHGFSPFMNFRTISLNSPAEKWIYPQKDGVKLIDSAFSEHISEYREIVVRVLDEVIEQFAAGVDSGD
jgi:hypothetical protein